MRKRFEKIFRKKNHRLHPLRIFFDPALFFDREKKRFSAIGEKGEVKTMAEKEAEKVESDSGKEPERKEEEALSEEEMRKVTGGRLFGNSIAGRVL
ncbi:MAG: hypothetical protein D6679_07455 [Candidatus Hydrogenedentota bacterium]|nr:MAG: hypothetical protein D6679_07455 [Candidatus Hydrogenedentota bacterium]